MTDIELDSLISKVGFHNNKTKYLKKTSEILQTQHDGDVPGDLHTLLSFPGVGPKMAHLFLQAAYGKVDGIGVDTHVHRIAARLGWTKAKDKQPEDTRIELESWLPRGRWQPVNALLVGLGQTICTPINPRCGDCPVRDAGLCPTGKKWR